VETLRAKFEFQDDDTWDAVTTARNHDDITVADGGTGIVDLTFPSCQNVHITATIDALVETHASQRVCTVSVIDEAAGTASILISSLGNPPAQADPVDLSILSIRVEIQR
jgi:hypothetical protein